MIKEFFVRQRWRISQTYLLISPFIGVLNTYLYFVIAVGVTDLFDLSLPVLIVVLITPFVIINLAGYWLDKVGYFRAESRKNLEGGTYDAVRIANDYLALRTAYYSKLSVDELAELLKAHEFVKWGK